MSLQDNMNCENLNLLYSYYEKFSSYFPNWRKSISNLVIWHCNLWFDANWQASYFQSQLVIWIKLEALNSHEEALDPGWGYSHTWPDGMCRSTGCPFAVKIMRQGIVIGKKIIWQGIIWKGKLCDRVSQAKILFLLCFWDATFLCNRVYPWPIFLRQGSECGEVFHTPPSIP